MTSLVVHDIMALPAETDLPGRPAGVTRRILHAAPDDSVVTWLMEFPRGYRSEWGRGREGDLESHRSTEEVIVLDGALGFGHWYELGPLHYSLHPAGWMHPAHQHSAGGCTLIIRRDSSNIDFEFHPAPEGWDGSSDALTRVDAASGVANVGLEAAVSELSPESADGLVARRLSASLAHGMQLFVVSVPAGWESDDGALASRGSETLVVSGGVMLRSSELGEVSLGRHGYLVGSTGSHDAIVGSADGALALRWVTE